MMPCEFLIQLGDALAYALDDRDNSLCRLRFGLDGEAPETLQVIGSGVNLSRERVRQLIKRDIRRVIRQGKSRKCPPGNPCQVLLNNVNRAVKPAEPGAGDRLAAFVKDNLPHLQFKTGHDLVASLLSQRIPDPTLVPVPHPPSVGADVSSLGPDIQTVNFVVLANSVKHHPNRCIAGRVVTQKQGRSMLGPWIRPVGDPPEAGLAPSASKYEDGCQPGILDVVEMRCRPCGNNHCQPENHSLEPGSAWKKIGTFPAERLGELEEHPDGLWRGTAAYNDSASHAKLLQMPNCHSLYLIRPEQLRFQISATSQPAGAPKVRRRALFRYRGVDYDLALTDSAVDDRYLNIAIKVNDPPVEVAISHPNRCLMVVSLGGEFNGYHYKLAASVIEY